MKNAYTLRKLQAAYLKVTLRKEMENNEDTCMMCWSTKCDCEFKTDVKSDSFINLTTISEFKVELQHA